MFLLQTKTKTSSIRFRSRWKNKPEVRAWPEMLVAGADADVIDVDDVGVFRHLNNFCDKVSNKLPITFDL